MNITFSLDAELIAAAKELAAGRGTSVNAIVRAALEHHLAVGGNSSGARMPSGVLQQLYDYSIGIRPRAVAMEAIGVTDYGAFLRLLNAAGLPHPVVPLAQRREMSSVLATLLNEQALQR